MTLGTNDENMYCVRANGLLKLVCWLVLYGKLCCTNSYSWRKVGDNFVHSGKFQKVAASGKWWKVQKL